MEGDLITSATAWQAPAFQSTPSAWRETFFIFFTSHSQNFNPLPPHGGRPGNDNGEGTSTRFQSTPSAWRETERKRLSNNIDMHFNPLPPHGGRLRWIFREYSSGNFNPLPPHGGRLKNSICWRFHFGISIHSLRMEGDLRSFYNCNFLRTFQSTPSAWRETIWDWEIVS